MPAKKPAQEKLNLGSKRCFRCQEEKDTAEFYLMTVRNRRGESVGKAPTTYCIACSKLAAKEALPKRNVTRRTRRAARTPEEIETDRARLRDESKGWLAKKIPALGRPLGDAESASRTSVWRKLQDGTRVKQQLRNSVLRKYRLTQQQWDALMEAQGRACASCGRGDSGRSNSTFSIDHDHVSGLVRGLLCHPCNVVLGQSGDSADGVRQLLERLLRYLETVPERMRAAGIEDIPIAKLRDRTAPPPRTFRPSPVRTFELPPLEPIVHAHPSGLPC